jgi:DNA-binding SARP family transcriptional activator
MLLRERVVSPLKLFVLGAPRLERDGHPVAVERRAALALLVYLAVTVERHRRDMLAALFWPEHDQTSARAALRRTLAALKGALSEEVLDVNREHIGLRHLEPDRGLWLDANQFHMFLAMCKTHGHSEDEACPTCLQPLTGAVALYRGDFLAGFTPRGAPDFNDWQLFQAETMRRELAWALERLTRCHAAQQEFESAINYARRWVALDPFHEPAHRQLIALYARAGQRQTALRQYVECVRLLERELGVPPQEATKQLYEAIKTDAIAPPPEPQPVSVPLRTEPPVPSPSTRTYLSQPVSADRPTSLLDRIVRGQLVGRKQEMMEIRTLWAGVAAGQGRVLLVSGEPGIGKTRLVREIAAQAEDSGARVLIGRCEPEGGPLYAPIAEMIRAGLEQTQATNRQVPEFVLTDLLTLAPQLRPRYPRIALSPPLDPPFEQLRLFDSFASWCALLAHDGPLFLWAEDVHWADPGTLALLRRLAHRLRDLRLLMVMTYRNTDVELAEVRTLKETLMELNRERLAEPLPLAPLSREQTRDLIAALLGTGGEITPEFLNSVYGETEGNPFFIEEVCKALIEEGQLFHAGGVWRRSDIHTIVIPPSVRTAILSRVERLPPPVQELLYLAAILGREFDAATLQALSGPEEEALSRDLEHAERAQLLGEVPRPGHLRFAFAHALIPFALRESLSGLRRQTLHRRAAGVLEARRPDDVEALAYHFTAAGEREKAIEYYRRAAQRAEAVYAYDAAIQRLHSALTLTEVTPAVETRLAVLEQLADAHRCIGERREAMTLYREALDLWDGQTGADKWLAVRLCRKIGETFLHMPSSAEMQPFDLAAQSSLEHGLKLTAGEPPHPETVRLLATLANDAWGARARQDWDAAERYAGAAVEMAEKLDAPLELSVALDALTTVYGVRGRYQERVQLALRRLAISRDVCFADRREQCRILCQTGNALLLVGEYAAALPYLAEAERLADHLRDVNLQTYALGLQAQGFFGLDRWDEMLRIEEQRSALEQRYGRDRVDRMCFYCGLRASVLTLRGDDGGAGYWRDVAYTEMAHAFGGPPERWPPAGHY